MRLISYRGTGERVCMGIVKIVLFARLFVTSVLTMSLFISNVRLFRIKTISTHFDKFREFIPEKVTRATYRHRIRDICKDYL